tara:strand:+ start:19 stop:1446 length:1428 start_codon:yes stop_codon:yes gene_type:complete
MNSLVKFITLSCLFPLILFSCSEDSIAENSVTEDSITEDSVAKIDIQATVNAAVKLAIEKELSKISTSSPIPTLLPIPTASAIPPIEIITISDKKAEISGSLEILQEIEFNQKVFNSNIVKDNISNDRYVKFQQFFCSIAKGTGKLFYLDFESNDSRKTNDIRFEICFENDNEVVTNKNILEAGDVITYHLEDKENYSFVSLIVQEIHKYDYEIEKILESYNPNYLYHVKSPEYWSNKFYLRDHYAQKYSAFNKEVLSNKLIQNKLPTGVRNEDDIQNILNYYKNYIYKNFPFYCADVYEISYSFQTLKNEFLKPSILLGLEDDATIYIEATQNIFTYNDMLFIFDVTNVDLEKTYSNINLTDKEDLIKSQKIALADYWFSINNINSIDDLRPSNFECPFVEDGPFKYFEDFIEPTPTPSEHLICKGEECWAPSENTGPGFPPVIQPQAEPVYEAPAAPVYEAPAAPAYVPPMMP